jgi:hypothetical protein
MQIGVQSINSGLYFITTFTGGKMISVQKQTIQR